MKWPKSDEFEGGGGDKEKLCNAPGENSMPLELFRKFAPLEQNSGKLAVTLLLPWYVKNGICSVANGLKPKEVVKWGKSTKKEQKL